MEVGIIIIVLLPLRILVFDPTIVASDVKVLLFIIF